MKKILFVLMMVCLLCLVGCGGAKPKSGKVDVVTQKLNINSNAIGMHNEQIDKKAKKIEKITNQSEVKDAAGDIQEHSAGIKEANGEVAEAVEDVEEIKADMQDLEKERDEAIADKNSPLRKKMMYLNYICVLIIGVGLGLFFFKGMNFGLYAAGTAFITLIVSITIMKYLAVITTIVGLALLAVVAFLGWQLWRGKITIKDLAYSFNAAKKYIKSDVKDQLKKEVQQLQSPHTELTVAKMRVKDPKLRGEQYDTIVTASPPTAAAPTV